MLATWCFNTCRDDHEAVCRVSPTCADTWARRRMLRERRDRRCRRTAGAHGRRNGPGQHRPAPAHRAEKLLICASGATSPSAPNDVNDSVTTGRRRISDKSSCQHQLRVATTPRRRFVTKGRHIHPRLHHENPGTSLSPEPTATAGHVLDGPVHPFASGLRTVEQRRSQPDGRRRGKQGYRHRQPCHSASRSALGQLSALPLDHAVTWAGQQPLRRSAQRNPRLGHHPDPRRRSAFSVDTPRPRTFGRCRSDALSRTWRRKYG